MRIVHTLTSMGCRRRPMIQRGIRDALAGIEGVESVEVDLVFASPWSPEGMSDDATFLLGVG